MYGVIYSNTFAKICENTLYVSAKESEGYEFSEQESFVHFTLPKAKVKRSADIVADN